MTRRAPYIALLGAGIAALAGAVAFIFFNLPAGNQIILTMRLASAGALVVAGISAAVGTVVFHAISGNHILTPSILGFDAVYALTVTVMLITTGEAAAGWDSPLLFIVHTTIMVGAALLLFSPLLVSDRIPLNLLLLGGVVLGILLRSLSTLLARALDPTHFNILRDSQFASFVAIDRRLLVVCLVLSIGTAIALWTRSQVYDAMSLGREAAVPLGVRFQRETLGAIAAIAVLVATSTALVGPILFLGLIVAHLAYRLSSTMALRWIIPLAALLGIATLMWTQFVLGQVLNYMTATPVVIDFFGGILLLALLLHKKAV